ncbi:MAG: hypothetical protein ACK5V3_05685 [Bdellovibrionales bacterium]
MKLLALSLLFISGLAQARSSTLEFNGTVTGTVKFETKWTATCAALGCPKSKAYTEVSLVNAEVSGYGIKSKVVLQPKGFDSFSSPLSFIVIKGTRIRPGLKVKLQGQIYYRTYSFIDQEHIVVQDIESLKVVR